MDVGGQTDKGIMRHTLSRAIRPKPCTLVGFEQSMWSPSFFAVIEVKAEGGHRPGRALQVQPLMGRSWLSVAQQQ